MAESLGKVLINAAGRHKYRINEFQLASSHCKLLVYTEDAAEATLSRLASKRLSPTSMSIKHLSFTAEASQQRSVFIG